jgi:ubiquinone/menaquinone biosynthesis C-methylase UbiE
MSLRNWLFRRTKAQAFDPWEKEITVKTPQPVQDTRHYLEASPYQLPKDAEEDDRLNFQHHALFHAIGNHYIAPISSPLPMILDVGTGTGIWASEMARLFPTAMVIGLDLAASSFKQPPQENCVLRTGNVLTGLPFPDALFSYTHQRLLVAGIPAEKWSGVVQELVRVTRPGGWVELVEIDNQMQNMGPETARMQDFMNSVSSSLGFDWEVIRHLGEMLTQAGLHHVEQQRIPIPVGEWGGRVGEMMKRDLLAATNAVRPRYCNQANISGADFDQMVEAVAREWDVFHSSCLFYAAYGKRGEA